jgi:hypothetical protein
MSTFEDLDIDAYLLEGDAAPWGELLEPFSPPLPGRFDLFLVTRFLDFFLIFTDGSVNWLEAQAGRISRVADTRADFEAMMEDEHPHWLMTGAVDEAVSRGWRLGPGQAYVYKAPPMLGGEYDFANIEVGEIEGAMRVLGDVFRQAKNLPEGARVRVETTP